MARERGQKKSFEQSLEDIKERMKEKRNKRLNSAVAPRGRSKNVNKTSAGNVRRVILKGVQLNNKVLAMALQAEKEKVRQANGVILQLKREQQALFLHLLLLKRRLKENEALANATQTVSQKIPNEIQNKVVVLSVMQASPVMDEPLMHAAPATSSDLQPLDDAGHCKVETQFNLPRTVGVRRRRAVSGRRSECGGRRHSFSLGDNSALPQSLIGGDLEERKAFTESPIPGDKTDQNQTQRDVVREATSPIGPEEFQHSTPDPTPAKPTSLQPPQPRRRGQAQLARPKPDPPTRKPERGRKQDRVPLKKPWESSKPRARSKSRDRSATRAKTTPAPQGDKLNTSLGFNDTFDFDCEGAVHLTPFRTKAEEAPPAAPIQEEASGKPHTSTGSLQETESSSSSESEGSPYVPQKIRKKLSPPGKVQAPPARRGRPLKAEVIPTQTRKSQRVSREEEGLRPTAAASTIPGKPELHPPQSPDCVFSGSSSPITNQKHDNPSEPQREEELEDSLPPVTPGIEAEMMRIDNVLCGFGDTPSQTPGLPGHTPPIAKTCRRGGLSVRAKGRGFSLCDVTNVSPAAYRKFPSTSSRPSDARCSTPVPARKRRCTMTVDYKEPSLHAKLRRGDKFTDTKFLRSPIFKQKPRKSIQNQSSLGKYDDSFVGCRY